MNVYLYIAQNNPDAAYEVCKKYGYFNVQSFEDLAASLQSIVAEHGESSLKEILDIHPDKEVILEMNDKKKVEEPPLEEIIQKVFDRNKRPEKEDCSCMKNADATPAVAAAPAQPQQSASVSQTNTYILVGALIVSIAILSMKK
jgi:hypothetical protein